MKYGLILMSVLMISVPAYAEPEACENRATVEVNGLVCDFCARALEKVFSKRDEVADISVDLDNGVVQVEHAEGQPPLDDATLKQLITDSGYNVTEIKRGC